jgi:SAM-dependent methyltransferase
MKQPNILFQSEENSAILFSGEDMTEDSRSVLRAYYDAAAPQYLSRASKGFMGWMRKRELALTLSMIPEKGSGKAIDVGCGPGYYSLVMKDRGFEVTAVDLSPEMVQTVRKLGIPAYEMDIEHSKPPDELTPPFKFVFCAGVLEFADEVKRFLTALRNLADEDAQLVIVAPMDGFFGRIYRAYLRRKGIPAKLYTKASLTTGLQSVGFEPVEIRATWPICLAVRATVVGKQKPE